MAKIELIVGHIGVMLIIESTKIELIGGHTGILKEVRTILPRPTNELEKTLPTEIAYADDVDFVGLNFVDTEEVQNTLHKYNLLVNIDKTEFTTLSRAGTEYKNTKKVGTLIGDEEDVERRKRLSNAALTKLLNVWIKGDKIKRKTKLKLYRSLVKSILVYNCGTWALTKSEEEKLNAFHRKQLRKVLNIKYPVKITNSSLYNKCEEHPLSIYILENRWRLFGHILRRNTKYPLIKSMNSYFKQATHGKKFPGPPFFNKHSLTSRPQQETYQDYKKTHYNSQLGERPRTPKMHRPEKTAMERTVDENPKSCRSAPVGRLRRGRP
ncbi:hypothetical protein RRG08_052142 [Elysia crispata]|uniref:Reverse transcriptase domain-containing protein n=1 Tax=Elysia crispata TaxID=231223 RepID=A0AAE1DZ73_9GAST|nr:hypothetical protein RRG08_052142 [Elysia crispata]